MFQSQGEHCQQSALSAGRRLRSLPLVTLHLTERCNSRCVSCDYWRHGREDLTLQSVSQLLPDLLELKTTTVLLSGGEPLIHPQWMQIAQLLRDAGLQLWLVTSGLSLAKHATRAAELFQSITVSLDGIDREMYAAIRGLDAFDNVCAGIRAAAAAGAPISIRMTVQRTNYSALPKLVTLAHALGARQVSFLAADVRNSHAFGRASGFNADIALQPHNLPGFKQTLDVLERDHIESFRSGFIAESPKKLRRMLQYFSALHGLSEFPPIRCNAPEFSAVIGAQGHVQPCFFIPGPTAKEAPRLAEILNSDAMIELRSTIRAGDRPECMTCVCSLWREPTARTAADFSLQRQAVAS